MEKEKNILCFNCASIFPDNNNRTLNCPVCESSFERDLYLYMISYASEAATFGHAYRVAYEKLHRCGNLKYTRHQIIVSDIWTFAAVAALSGIIGNIAYDVVKLAIFNIIKSLQKKDESPSISVPRLLRSTEGVDIFMNHIRDFCNNLDSIDPEVRNAIIEEMVVDITVNLRFADDNTKRVKGLSLNPQSADELEEMLMRPLITSSITKKPAKRDFKGFWCNLPSEPSSQSSRKKESQKGKKQ